MILIDNTNEMEYIMKRRELERYCTEVLKGKVLDEGGFPVCRFKWGVLIKTVPLDKIKEHKLLE